MPIDFTTPNGQVRAIIPDIDEENLIFQTAPPAGTDLIDVYLTIEKGNVKRAAAMAIEAIARDEALLLKVIRMGIYEADGAKLANTLLESARMYRTQADTDELRDGEDAGFEIAEQIGTSWQEAQHIWHEAQRRGG